MACRAEARAQVGEPAASHPRRPEWKSKFYAVSVHEPSLLNIDAKSCLTTSHVDFHTADGWRWPLPMASNAVPSLAKVSSTSARDWFHCFFRRAGPVFLEALDSVCASAVHEHHRRQTIITVVSIREGSSASPHSTSVDRATALRASPRPSSLANSTDRATR